MKKEIRMMAAIMFTDMVGYTALMQENEKKAKKLRDKHRDVLERLVSEHRGQILQYYGDGTLVIFGSCIEASVCAMKIQQELQNEPVVPLRIGIHVGDVVYDDEGVYGDSVNIASRIENLSVPGSVLISEKINDELRNQKDINTLAVGAYELKNVKYPVKLFAVSSDGIVVPTPEQISGKAIRSDQSIAVLPFVNLSADKDNEYFSDGITEEILNALARVTGLMVTSRTSSFAFKGMNADIRDIGKQLGVRTVLEGSVRKHGDKVRVTAQLINTDDGYHRWSEVYDRNLEDIFSVQDELAHSIVNQLIKTFTVSKPEKKLVKIPTDNLEAYNLYLKGLFHWNRWTPDSVQKAIKFSEEAIRIEPNFVLPYARLSACYVFLGATGVFPQQIANPKAEDYALKALELDSNDPASHVSLAMVNYFYKWDWSGSQRCFLKAIELNPNSAEAHQYYAMLLMTLGHFKKAVKEAELAYQLDPINVSVSSILAFAYMSVNALDAALNQYDKTREIDPDFRETWNGLGWLHFRRGEFDKALELFSNTLNIKNYNQKAIAAMGYIYGKMGNLEKAKEYLQLIESMQSEELNLEIEIAVLNAGLGIYDKTFEYLNIACDKKLSGMNFIRSYHWKEIQDDPRFPQLLKRMGLPEE
jgi:TolB-like protein/tetratricopeptide (TPR) repeat protein